MLTQGSIAKKKFTKIFFQNFSNWITNSWKLDGNIKLNSRQSDKKIPIKRARKRNKEIERCLALFISHHFHQTASVNENYWSKFCFSPFSMFFFVPLFPLKFEIGRHLVYTNENRLKYFLLLLIRRVSKKWVGWDY